jgi:hypothetical protein
MEFACVNMGLDVDVFYGLTWYEYRLAVKRYEHQEKEKLDLREDHWEMFRIHWADFHNVNRGKNGTVVKGTDLIKLSRDKIDTETAVATPDIEEVKKKFGSKIKNRKNGK